MNRELYDLDYEDDLIDDLDVIIPPKVYLNNIIPNIDFNYVRREWIKFVLNNMEEESYRSYVNDFIRSMKMEVQKKLWKKELDGMTKQNVKDEDVIELKNKQIEDETERLTNNMLDGMNGWFEDLNFKKVNNGKN